jgi:hypothetical protein
MSNHAFPEYGFVRLSQIIGDSKVEPPVPPDIPVSKSTWCQGVKDGRFTKPVKIGPKITVCEPRSFEYLSKTLIGSSRPYIDNEQKGLFRGSPALTRSAGQGIGDIAVRQKVPFNTSTFNKTSVSYL